MNTLTTLLAFSSDERQTSYYDVDLYSSPYSISPSLLFSLSLSHYLPPSISFGILAPSSYPHSIVFVQIRVSEIIAIVILMKTQQMSNKA